MTAHRFVVLLGIAALSLLIPAAPDYDAWAYLTWGREVAHLELSTADGPAFKPLPVAICALLTPLSSAAPEGWLVVVRAGTLAAVALAARLAVDLAPQPRLRPLAAASAGLGVLLTGGLVRHAAVGDAEPLLVALGLAAWQRHRAGRRGQALALGGLAGLVRVETWPFLAAYGVWLARHRPLRMVAVAGLGSAVVAAWLLPELAGSGQLLRSGDRALVPNPGAPALADRPLLASLGDAFALLPPAFAAAALAAPRAARLPVVAALGWCLLVAGMAEAGFSGEARYALPGVALVAVSAGAGAARLAGSRLGAAAAIAILLFTAVLGVRDLRALGPRLADHAELAADLTTAVRRAGGRTELLACGRPAVGRYRGTMLAYALDVPKQRVRADDLPDAVTFRSRLHPATGVTPAAPPHAHLLAASARWRVEARCVRTAGRSAARAR